MLADAGGWLEGPLEGSLCVSNSSNALQPQEERRRYETVQQQEERRRCESVQQQEERRRCETVQQQKARELMGLGAKARVEMGRAEEGGFEWPDGGRSGGPTVAAARSSRWVVCSCGVDVLNTHIVVNMLMACG
jgi:hypothetical protein